MINVTPVTQLHNSHILEIVPVSTGKVIEIGTGSGALAREIKTKCHDVNYIGVEIYSEYAELSKSHCDRVYIEDFESASGELLREFNETDIVIFADVLEHFKDPWAVLKRIKDWLPPGRRIIACIPNIQHWSVQYGIISGNFVYTETGLLDKTHLRFFTRKTMINMFESSGYKVELVIPRIFDFPGQPEALAVISNSAERFKLDVAECIQDAAAFQYVFVAES